MHIYNNHSQFFKHAIPITSKSFMQHANLIHLKIKLLQPYTSQRSRLHMQNYKSYQAEKGHWYKGNQQNLGSKGWDNRNSITEAKYLT